MRLRSVLLSGLPAPGQWPNRQVGLKQSHMGTLPDGRATAPLAVALINTVLRDNLKLR